MTDATTTGDILAAGLLITDNVLSVDTYNAGAELHYQCWSAIDGMEHHQGTGPTWTAAVRAWAESAGVPWPSVKVVQRWAFLIDGLPGDAYQTKEYAVVIRETEGA